MKKLTFILGFLLISLLSIAQDVVVFKHTNYTSHFSKSKRYPVMVEWWETKAKVGCPNPLPRVDAFRPDPQDMQLTDIKADYVGSGFDRGHMSPAASNQCQTMDVQMECFYMSNMAPQYHSLNAGDWKSLETATRQWALKDDSVHVWAGNLGEIKKIGKVSVPKECWKVVYIKKSNEWFYFMFDNSAAKPSGLKSHEVTKDILEKATGLKFK